MRTTGGGMVALRITDVHVGDAAPPVEVVLSRTDFVRYAGVSGDLNPMHHDETKATASGMPSVFGHGMLSAGLLASAITEWLGVGTLSRYAVRFTRQAWPDVPLVAQVEVVSKDELMGTVELSCRLVTAEGTAVVQGDATAKLRP